MSEKPKTCTRCGHGTEKLFSIRYREIEGPAEIMEGLICLPCYENVLVLPKVSHPIPPTSTQPNPTPPNPTRDDAQRDFLIKSLLSKERPVFAQLKAGIHAGLFYYGTAIYEGGYSRSALVTSDRRLLLDWGKGRKNELKEVLDLHYRFPLDYEALDGHFSNQAIQRWLEGAEAKSLSDLFQAVLTQNQTFMDYPDPRTHEVVALDILSTYFLPCFEAKGRTFLEAEKGSGKTRQCTIYKLLAFNSVMSADITKSAFFRLMESTVATLIIDDFDSIGEEQKTDVLQHYKTGYKDSSKSVRVGEGKIRKIESFRNYGHVIMNNTGGLDEISAERTIYLPILRSDKARLSKPLQESSQEWVALRDDLTLGGLQHWQAVKEAYEVVKSNLKGRRFEISRALLALASLIDPELQARLEEWLRESLEGSQATDTETDWAFLTLQEFLSLTDGEHRTIKGLAEVLIKQQWNQEDRLYKSKLHGCTVWLGKHFRRLPGIFKVVMVNGTTCAKLLSTQRLQEYLDGKGWSRVEVKGLGGVGIGLETKEEMIGQTSKSTYETPVQTFLRTAENGRIYTVETVAELCDLTTEQAAAELAAAAERGEAYQPRPGHWGVLR